MRIALLVVIELLAVLSLLIVVARVVIPLSAPAPPAPRATLVTDVLHTCPRLAPGCR